MLHVDQLRKIQLEDYVGIVGEKRIDSVKALAEKLKGKSVTHINSIFWGRGSRNASKFGSYTEGCGVGRSLGSYQGFA